MDKDNQLSLRGLLVWLVCALFFMYEFLLRTILGTFQHPLMQDLDLSPVRFALLSATSYQLIYGMMQIPVGLITDAFGLKKTLLGAVIICTMANFGFSMAHGFDVAIMFRILMGLGSSFGFVCLLVAVYDWMPRKHSALFIGISQFIGTMGPMLAAGPLNALSESNFVNWRSVFYALSLMGIVIAILVFMFVDKNRQRQDKFIILNRPVNILDSLKHLVSQPQVWFIAIFSASIYFSIEYFSENEGTSFLKSKGFSSNFASYMITLCWFGYAISCPLLGFISDRLQKRTPVMLAAAVVLIASLIGIIWLPLGQIATALCFLGLGLGASGQSIGFAIIAEHCRSSYLAVGLGFNNAMIMVFSASIAPLIGHLIEQQSSINLSFYQHVFTLVIGLAFISVVMACCFIKETFCKSTRENTRLNP